MHQLQGRVYRGCDVLVILGVPHELNTCRRRYEDNQEPVTHLMVMKNPTDKGSITAYGGMDKFLDQYKFLLGEQVYKGAPACRSY